MTHGMPSIPLVNLKRQYERLASEIDCALRDVCLRADFILGTAVSDFEQAFAEYLGVRHGIGVAAGFSFYPGKNLGAYGDGGAALDVPMAMPPV